MSAIVTKINTTNETNIPLDADEERIVESELIRILLVRLFFSSRTSVIGYGALAILLKDVVATIQLIAWFVALLLSELTNCVIEWKVMHRLDDPLARHRWQRLLPGSVLVTGMLWGCAAILPGVTDDPGMYLMTLLFLAVVAIMSVHNLCFDRTIVTVFTVGIALPLIMAGASAPAGSQGMLALAAVVLLIMLQFYSQATRKLYVSDIRSHILTKRLARDLEHSNEELTRALKEVNELATQDPMTRCLNRRAMMARLEQEFARSQRYPERFGVIMIDADHFKSINDTHGHSVGDAVLIALAELVRSCLRSSDCLSRWGGEEFLCAVINIDHATLMKKAQEMCDKLSSNPLLETPALTVTASFGIALWEPDLSIESLIEKADQALYRAKKSGRNRVCA